MNRRTLFGRLFGGLLGSTVSMPEVVERAEKLQPFYGEALNFTPLHSSFSISLNDDAIKDIINTTLSRVKLYSPDGSFVIPAFTNDEDDDTIHMAASSG